MDLAWCTKPSFLVEPDFLVNQPTLIMRFLAFSPLFILELNILRVNQFVLSSFPTTIHNTYYLHSEASYISLKNSVAAL